MKIVGPYSTLHISQADMVYAKKAICGHVNEKEVRKNFASVLDIKIPEHYFQYAWYILIASMSAVLIVSGWFITIIFRALL